MLSLYRCSQLAKNFSTTACCFAKLDAEIYDQLEKNELKPKKHPGILKRPVFSLPKDVMKAIDIVIGDTSRQDLIEKGQSFSKYLFARHEPPEKDAILQKKKECRVEVIRSIPVSLDDMEAEEKKYYSQVIKSKVDVLLKQRLYHWQNIEYTRHSGLVYIFARAAAEYAVLSQIFQELSLNYSFKPRTLFDFASGVGTVTWAANMIWPKSLKYIYTVDTSADMNDLSYEIYSLLEDKSLKDKIFQRQFLPASTQKQENFDMVTSAYALLDLPSSTARLEVISNLWQKAKYVLVLVEQGTKSGFKVLNEARDFIINLQKKNEQQCFHILAPCPHDFTCPRANYMCRFEAKYTSENLSNSKQAKEYYSYVIFSKGMRATNDRQWPRIISPVLVKSRHAICRLCTKFGDYQEVIISHGKHGKITHHCARSSSWGDRLPLELTPKNESL